MQHLRLAPAVGIGACLAVVAVLAAPFLVDAASTGGYYGSGAVNPLLAGLFGVVCLVVLAAGREGRSDPGLAAGVALALGLFMTLVAVAWALTVRIDAIEIASYHRWVLVGAAAVVPLSAAWFARALDLL